ncbi:NADP-dependent oxidoreductase [Weissella confusa]|uniref:NADP-dependent oxidoreductase n=1 Tax=Weissella confusa TaxID=1583 RepID=UPI00168019ED|nr:NADP-dependent oxidoreductase [Weissella confusa]MBD1491157.1 NADP-dependent oxidoreductase [Weissella confusa]MBJ7663165.1 NADP-dependent oxidoreductase [Weissella confusa]
MTTMKAVVFDEFGDVDVFHEAEVEVPVLTKGSILIKQAAIAMDPYDVKFRAGAFGVPAKKNMIGGSTIAGVVEAVAADVTEFKVGERVVAVPHEHGYAEYAVVDADTAGHLPDSVSFEDAAALALGGQTGYQAVVDALNLQEGESILIHGGAGAVGYAALQTALYRGASKIYTTSLPTDIDYLHELNADIETIDFTTQKFTDVIPESSVDTVVEIIGGNNALGSMQVLKEGGRIVSTVPLGDDVKAARDAKNIKGDYYVMQSTTEVLTKLMEHLGNGDYKVAVAEVKPFNLENLKEGHKIVESQAVRGKVVLTF